MFTPEWFIYEYSVRVLCRNFCEWITFLMSDFHKLYVVSVMSIRVIDKYYVHVVGNAEPINKTEQGLLKISVYII